jgi:hypothetical protein
MVFGGFASTKWCSDGKPVIHGKNSFLFSLTNDAVLPFQPHADDACHLFATPECFTIGRRDLVLAGDFNVCSSELENSYTAGFEPGRKDAKTLLAGKPNFVADVVEFWAFVTVPSTAE